METILSIYYLVPPFVWGFALGAPFIVFFVNVCKKLFGVNSTLVIHTLTVTTGWILVNAPEYLGHNPKPLIFNAAFTSALFTVANFLYAASKKLQPFFKAVEQYEAKKSANKTVQTTTTSSTPAVFTSTGTDNLAAPAVAAQYADPTVFQG